MSEPYIGEIRMFAGNFAPTGWNFCDGSTLAIADYSALFNLIGTTYGGDGTTTFALPDLRSRLPIHQGTSFAIGADGGAENVTLTGTQIPPHSHPFVAVSDIGALSVPSGNLLAQSSTIKLYSAATLPGGDALGAGSIAQTGGGQPHSNIQPYLCINFIISLLGIYPTQA